MVSLLCAVKAVSKCFLRVFNTCIYYFYIDAGNSKELYMNNSLHVLNMSYLQFSFPDVCPKCVNIMA